MRMTFICALTALALGSSACSTSTEPAETATAAVEHRSEKNDATIQKRVSGPTVVGSVDLNDCLTGEHIHFTGQESSITSTTAAGRTTVTTFVGSYTSPSGHTLTTRTTNEYRRPNYNQKTGQGMCPYTLIVTHSSTMTGASAPYEYQDVIEYDANCNNVSYTRVYQRGGC